MRWEGDDSSVSELLFAVPGSPKCEACYGGWGTVGSRNSTNSGFSLKIARFIDRLDVDLRADIRYVRESLL